MRGHGGVEGPSLRGVPRGCGLGGKTLERGKPGWWLKETDPTTKRTELCTSSRQPGLGSIPAGGRQPLDPPHRGAAVLVAGLPPAGGWGCASATAAPEVVKITEELQMIDIGVALQSRRSLAMVMGTRGWAAAAWGQALLGESQRAASGGKGGSPNPERTRWDGGSLGQGLSARLGGRQPLSMAYI